MRRSSRISLVLLASVSLVAITACQEEAQETVFKDKAECVAKLDTSTCDTVFAQAVETHQKNAPKFMSREDCEQEFGAGTCVTNQEFAQRTGSAPAQQNASNDGGSSFMPFMMGYMVGNMLSDNRREVVPVYVGRDDERGRKQVYSSASPVWNSTVPYSRASSPEYARPAPLGYTSTPTSKGGSIGSVKTTKPAFTSSGSSSSGKVSGGSSVSSRGGFGGAGASASASS